MSGLLPHTLIESVRRHAVAGDIYSFGIVVLGRSPNGATRAMRPIAMHSQVRSAAFRSRESPRAQRRGHALAGELADAALVLVLANPLPVPGPPNVRRRSSSACRALAVVALSRVLALGLPLRDASPAVATLVVALLVAGSAVVVTGAVGLPVRKMVSTEHWRLQLATVLAGVLLGLLAHAVGAPRLWRPGTPSERIVLLLVATLAAAIAEEILFRWLVQLSLQRIAGRVGLVASVGLFVATYLSVGSAALVIVIALAGAIFAAGVSRSGTLLGAIGGHSAFALGAGALWPLVLGNDLRVGRGLGPTIGITVALLAVAGIALLRRESPTGATEAAGAPEVAEERRGDEPTEGVHYMVCA